VWRRPHRGAAGAPLSTHSTLFVVGEVGGFKTFKHKQLLWVRGGRAAGAPLSTHSTLFAVLRFEFGVWGLGFRDELRVSGLGFRFWVY